MAVRVGINGFGRIGRNFFRAQQALGADVEIVAVNDLGDAATMAHLLKYDSTLGPFPGEVSLGDGVINAGGEQMKMLSERDPAALPWGELGVDVVLESTGFFTSRDGAQKHLDAGAKKVVISAPATDPDFTVVLGVNDDGYDRAQHHIVSNASCTTNCVAPLAKVLDDLAGIESGFMTTIHAYTNDQSILDLPHKDLRRARAAAINLIPTSTGAAKAIGLVLPHLKGKVDGVSVRAPVPTGSITDLVVTVGRDVTAEEIDAAYQAAAAGPLAGILQYQPDPIVSTDIKGSPYSCIYDAELTMVHGRNVKVFGWYDNEWGYSCRLVDLMGKLLVRLPRSVETADVEGKRVLVRADLNVPLDGGEIADDTRIRAAIPTLQLLLDRGAAAVTVCSHLGRPKTEADREQYAIAPVERRLRELVPDERLRVLENTRFNAGETKNDEGYARELADGNDLYVNDAFGSAHRAHSSTEAVAHLLPAYAGLLLLAELDHLGRLLGEVEHPFVLIAGGAKVDDKLAVLENLGGRADRVLIGGKMAEQVREHNPLSFPVELPVDVVAARGVRRGRRGARRDGRRDPGGLARPRHRARHGRGIRRHHPRGTDDLLERPDGRVRVEPVRRRHARDRRGGGRRGRVRCRRRRRLRPRDPGARPGRPRSRGFRRAAVRRSSCSRAGSFPASLRFRKGTTMSRS